MKREIKFRSWDGTRMSFNYIMFRNTDGALFSTIPDLKIMQFTGLKDKNGKEIYEGDIVKYDTKSEGVEAEWSAPVEITWNSKKAQFDFNDSFDGLIYKGYEVIGNIYENPEPLTP